MKRIGALLLSASLVLAGAAQAQAQAQAQDQTLADMRQEMAVLFVELTKIKRELSTTGAPNTAFGGTSTIERVDQIERALAALTAKTEALENRVNRIASEGTNKLDDLNFRLCELEKGCDIGNLPALQPLGGVAPVVAAAPTETTAQDNGVQLAVGEKADFDAAQAAFDGGDWQKAAQGFESFVINYPGGPLSANAHFLRGEALEKLGETSAAARAYLTAFSGAPDGEKAPDALFKLGSSLSQLGQTSEACVTLGEVGNRFPGSAAAGAAGTKMSELGCS